MRGLAGLGRGIAGKLRRKQPAPGWLSHEVEKAMDTLRGGEAPPHSLLGFRTLIVPSASSAWVIVILSLATLPVSWMSSLWQPSFLSLDDADLVVGTLQTMWQVQAAIAGVAVPLLVFLIQSAKDQGGAATHTHDVLVRNSLIFPLVVYSLMGTLEIGIAVLSFPRGAVALVDFILILLPTVGFAVFAYLTVLRLLFAPARLRSEGMKVVRERMAKSLDASIDIRVGNNLLFACLRDVGVDYWPFSSSRDEADEYVTLRAHRAGVISDLHLGKLIALIESLPPKSDERAGVVGVTESTSSSVREVSTPDQEAVWLLKKYGQRIGSKDLAIVRIRRSSFGELRSDALESELGDALRVESDEG